MRIQERMDMKKITDTYFVSPQIEASDLPEIAAAGISTIICNRPDAEVPPALAAEEIAAKAADLGLAFHHLPLTHQTMTPANVARHMEFAGAADGAVLAYCASGTRSSVVWALGSVSERGADDVLNATAQAGYDLSGLRPALEGLAAQAKS